jgi:hypothetical protein
MAKTTGPITMEIKITDTAFGAHMRDSLLAIIDLTEAWDAAHPEHCDPYAQQVLDAIEAVVSA